MNRINFAQLLLAAFLLIAPNLASQGSRPKIGVTLSGGGAKGFAHIGILQALDSAGLKVDYITGTSMGSVVGGLYAAGYSGDSIEALSRRIDWNLLFSTAPQLEAIRIEEKDEFNKYVLEVPVKKGKISIGTGIIEGQELWLKFAELFHPVYNVTDFSKLSIPFKCIGTDLSTGDAVVMDKGNIITCIRASMAIPSVFTPVEYQGKILVDGGVVNNFPVLDVKAMGADLVIGVNLNKGLDKAQDLETIFDILLQLAFFKDADYFEKHRKECDIYILPELRGFSTGDFARAGSIIDIGKACGRSYYPLFKRIADSLNARYGAKTFIKDRLPQEKKIRIDSYSVVGLKKTTSKFFFGLLGLKDSTEFSHQKFAEAIRMVYGSRYYKKISYDFKQNSAGQTELRFLVEENALTAMKFGLNYNSFTDLSLILNLTARDLLLKESRALVSFALSENPRLNVEYFKFIGKRRRFGTNLSYYKEGIDYPVYNDFDLSETMRSNYSNFDVRIQYALNHNSYIGISQQFNDSKLKTVETPEYVFKTKDSYYHTYLSYYLNDVDKKYFTTSGWKIRAEGGYVFAQDFEHSISQDGAESRSDSALFSSDDYVRLFLKADHFTPLNSRFVLQENFTGGYISVDRPFPTNGFQIGGIGENIANQIQFAGLSDTEVKTELAASLQLALQYKISKTVYITGRVNGGMYNFHNQTSNTASATQNFLTGYALTLGLSSPIGPIEITTMYCDQDGRLRTNLNLGFRFLKQ